MFLKRYLAMTAAEIHSAMQLPESIAWMACHFSPYSTGISNMPQSLPPESMLILNDRISIHDHVPDTVAAQLSELAQTLDAACILLDLQRPGSALTARVVRAVLERAQCPVGVSACYAEDLRCPVFLPPVPLRVRPEQYLAPWQGRELWLELALDSQTVTVTQQGVTVTEGKPPEGTVLEETELFFHYSLCVDTSAAEFRIRRTPADLARLLDAVRPMGVTRTVGLFQELG